MCFLRDIKCHHMVLVSFHLCHYATVTASGDCTFVGDKVNSTLNCLWLTGIGLINPGWLCAHVS